MRPNLLSPDVQMQVKSPRMVGSTPTAHRMYRRLRNPASTMSDQELASENPIPQLPVGEVLISWYLTR
jgi:hypothetical protein